MNLILYQTLEDRGNPEEVEYHGPYKCIRSDAWLGFGYYFWDAHIELAHKWGSEAYKKRKGKDYIICRADAVYDDFCWDLHGNGLHLNEFEEACTYLVDEGVCREDELLVAQVIEFVKNNGKFNYDSIRAAGVNLNNRDNFITNSTYKIRFVAEKSVYLNLKPSVQVCLLTKKALSLRDYLVVYPPEYSLQYG